MTKIGLLIASTRPNRVCLPLAEHLRGMLAARHPQVEIDMIDLQEVALPSFNEPNPPKSGAEKTTEHARAWAERVGALDGIVIITPQYNGSYPGALKNAVDYLHAEWGNLPAVMIGYGWREAVELLELLDRLMNWVGADVVTGIGLKLLEDVSREGEVTLREEKAELVNRALQELVDRAAARALSSSAPAAS